MFTGIVEATGSVRSLLKKGGDYQVTIESGDLDLTDVKLGDSIATNGVCLTVVALHSDGYVADVSNETIKHTGFAHYQTGQMVNLEKAMLPTTRFGGHMVSGHVDTTSQLTRIVNNGRAIDLWFTLSPEIAKYVVKKGSITIDGVSLTVNDVTADLFKLTIVPHTSSQTTLEKLTVGTAVNVEVDIIARYVERLVSKSDEGVTMGLLAKSGFLK